MTRECLEKGKTFYVFYIFVSKNFPKNIVTFSIFINKLAFSFLTYFTKILSKTIYFDKYDTNSYRKLQGTKTYNCLFITNLFTIKLSLLYNIGGNILISSVPHFWPISHYGGRSGSYLLHYTLSYTLCYDCLIYSQLEMMEKM